MKKLILISFFLCSLLLLGCSKSSQSFILICEAEGFHDRYYEFKDTEVVLKNILNELGLRAKLGITESDVSDQEKEMKLFILEERESVMPIIESSDGFIKFGFPKNEGVTQIHMLNRANLEITTTTQMLDPSGAMAEAIEGFPTSPFSITNKCKKPAI